MTNSFPIATPPSLRKGQTIFIFLCWLRDKGMPSFYDFPNGCIADPFNIPDADWDRLYAEFLAEHSK